ncbi:hypothetical protein BS78_03G112100 [Paspalum vaginatum]|nr:hypothetical protein BS78_03G112100 [Paspalum vaginatum]
MGNPTLALPAPEGDGGTDKQLQQAPPDPPPPPPGAKVDPPATVATHTRTIGIIRPPPRIRVIIEKLATFVAKNGPGFERRVISDNQGRRRRRTRRWRRGGLKGRAFCRLCALLLGAAAPGAGAAKGCALHGAAA